MPCSELNYEFEVEKCVEFLAEYHNKTEQSDKFAAVKYNRRGNVFVMRLQESYVFFCVFYTHNRGLRIFGSTLYIKAIGIAFLWLFLFYGGVLFMSLINVSNLTFGYDGSYDNIFENASFQLDSSWRLGFTGRNGRGKTTFLRLLQGCYEYAGSITASVDFEYFPYEVEDKTLLTYEVIGEIYADYLQWQLLRELNLLKVSEDVLYRPFGTLSNGEQTKVLLAVLFLKENNFLLIDEPTNHLDAAARKTVSDYLNTKKGFILVSHDRRFLDSCVDHILSINRTDIEVRKGNFSSWMADKEARDTFEREENERLKKDIKRLSAAAKKTAEWSDRAESRKIGFNPKQVEKSLTRRPNEAAKAKKMMSRSVQIQSRREKAVEEKEMLLRNIEEAAPLKIHPLKFHTGRLAELTDISVSYGDNRVCEGFSLRIDEGERIALSGRNGCGKSSILKLLCGEEITHTGEIIKNPNLKISFLPQDAVFMRENLTEYAERNGIDESLFKAILRKLDFSRVQFDKSMEDFSGGQKKKVLIAESLCREAHLYIWDEPLNFIDVFSRIQIEQLLKDFQPTLLFVEHDAAFCANIATRVVEMK